MHGTSAKITFLKLFLVSNSSYLTYLFWHVGAQNTVWDSVLWQYRGHMWSDRWKEHISAARTSEHGVIHC